MYFSREMRACWLAAGKQFPVLLLTGPRQVGKTTFLQHLCEEERTYVTLDDPNLRVLAREDPGLFLQRFGPPLLIDEIQYAPELLPHVKMAVDSDRQPGAFWLTGSQQFQMMRGVSETLAGRAAILHLLGFSNRERHELSLEVAPFLPGRESSDSRGDGVNSTLKQVFHDIWLGAFPALTAGPITDRDLFYSSYLQTYLERDVKDLSQVGDQAAFLRFLRACAARTGQMLNLTDLARDADVAVNTAKNWLSILQASFQVCILEPYHTNVTKRLVKAPKLYMLDTGLCAYLTEWSSPETLATGAMASAIFETHVFCELLKSWWHRGRQPRIYYYRDKDKKEVDFLVEQDQQLYPIEAKITATPKRELAKSFQPLAKLQKPIAKAAVVCLCTQAIPLSDIVDALPVGMI